MLCSNRFEPPGVPSTCTLDTAIIPIPSFILILLLLCRLGFRWNILPEPAFYKHWISRQHAYHIRFMHNWVCTIYILFIIAAFGMNVVQIARLVASKEGVGLLPVTLVSLFLALAAFRDSLRSYSLIPYWFLWVALQSLNVARLDKLNKLYPAKGSKYPSSDKLLDNAVMLGLYAINLLLELRVLYQMHVVVPRNWRANGHGTQTPSAPTTGSPQANDMKTPEVSQESKV